MKQGSSLWRALLRKTNDILQTCLPALLPLCSWRVSKPVSQENYAQNTAHDIAGRFIFDQNTPEIHAFRFGKSRADASGCGPISVYNALLLTGRHFGFSEVIRRMERERGAVRSGVWGANPAAIARVLPLFGVRPRHFREPEQLANAMKNGDTAILMTWNDKNDLRRGAHFFAVQKTAGGYQAYNRFSGQETPFVRANFSEILANARYLSGYVLSPAGSGETFFACPVSSACPSSVRTASSASLASPSSPVFPASCISSASSASSDSSFSSAPSASPSPSSVSPSPSVSSASPLSSASSPSTTSPYFPAKEGS